jgi:hypothetical protein
LLRLTATQTTLVVKYLLAARPPHDEGIAWGVQNVIWNAGIMAGAVVLWVAQLGGDEYELRPSPLLPPSARPCRSLTTCVRDLGLCRYNINL